MSIVGNLWPIAWWVGLCVVIFFDRALYQRLLNAIDAGEQPAMKRLVVWTAAQSIYGNALAVMLWFAPYVPGESLAVIYLCGGLANAIATLRAHAGLTLAGAVPTLGFLMGLPIFKFFANGANDTADLMLVVGALLARCCCWALVSIFGRACWLLMQRTRARKKPLSANNKPRRPPRSPRPTLFSA